jgi:hypothetical protein
MERTSPHDNVNVRVNNSFNGNIVIVGGIYVGGVSSIFLILFLVTHWQQAIVISGVLVYGVLSLFGLVVTGLIAALLIRLVYIPWKAARAQENKNKILHHQDNAIVIVNALGNVEVVPLVEGLKPTVVESDPTNELTIVDLHKHDVPQKLIAEGMNISQSTVSRVIAKHKKKTSAS